MNKTNLIQLGSSLEVDKDHLLCDIEKGSVLLIHLEEQEYPFEVHDKIAEKIVCISGQFTLETDEEQMEIHQGEMVTIRKGLRHRFGKGSKAIIMVIFG
ncbi:cupin domain-containing protein [Bacillus spongiae]|uniref:Cupin domain-containing protein n=1 Tax=Bacillus spongiae TaxID=2683610 RepID=A0ABU8HAT3_9BACI